MFLLISIKLNNLAKANSILEFNLFTEIQLDSIHFIYKAPNHNKSHLTALQRYRPIHCNTIIIQSN